MGTVWLLIASQTFILLPAYHLAFVRDCLDVIFILVTWLVQGVLKPKCIGLSWSIAYAKQANVIVNVRAITRFFFMAHLAISMPLSHFGFFRVVKPFDFYHHAWGPGFPEVLNSSHIRKVRAAGREKHSTISNSHRVSAPHNCLVEKFSGLSF